MRDHLNNVKAVIFDVDGTMYRQGPVRRAVFWRLLRTYTLDPALGLLTMRVLGAYRKAQETLRTLDADYSDIAKAQLHLTCEWTGVDSDFVSACVIRWMEQEPLRLLVPSLQRGLLDFLWEAKRCGLQLGVFSDYPAETKLEAMGIAGFFSAVVSAQDPGVQKFKPSPHGLQVTIQRLRVERGGVLYIGDRPEVDAPAATAAGVACAIIVNRKRDHAQCCRWTEIQDYRELQKMICN